jgi:hypothetical protein
MTLSGQVEREVDKNIKSLTKGKFPMNSQNHKWGIAGQRLRLVAGGLLLLLALFLAFRGGKDGSAPKPHLAAQGKSSAVGSEKPSPDSGNGTVKPKESPSKGSSPAKATRKPNPSVLADSDQESFPQIERLLGDESISVDETARQLSEIVGRKDLPEAERLEAMKHGLNLNFKALAEVVRDPDLPSPMAQLYVEELMNHNQERQGQMEACLSLMNHRDEEIRKQAQDLLAFYLGEESLAENPDELRKAAAEWLETQKVEEKDRKPEAGDPSSF